MAAIENEKVYGLKIRESADDGSDFGTPDADYRYFYVGEDGDLHLKDSSDTVTDFPAGGGGGGTGPTTEYKTADQSVTSSTTLVNVTDLVFAIGASERWGYRFVIFYDATTGGDIKFAITAPAGVADLRWGSGVTRGPGEGTWADATVSGSGTERGFAGRGAGDIASLVIEGFVENGATGGSIQLQFAQNTSNGTASIVKENSYLVAHQLA